MATERQREEHEIYSAEELRRLLSSNIKTYESAEVAILHIMEEHHFSPALLRQIMYGPFVFFSPWKFVGSGLLP